MATTAQLVGQVAEILNARELVLNLGDEQGVRPGMKFAILTDPLVIKDPTTQEELETLVREKTRVEVKEVHKRIAICRTYRTKTVVDPWPSAPSLEELERKLIPKMLQREEPERFAVENWSTGPAAASYDEQYVKVGDVAKLLAE